MQAKETSIRRRDLHGLGDERNDDHIDERGQIEPGDLEDADIQDGQQAEDPDPFEGIALQRHDGVDLLPVVQEGLHILAEIACCHQVQEEPGHQQGLFVLGTVELEGKKGDDEGHDHSGSEFPRHWRPPFAG